MESGGSHLFLTYLVIEINIQFNKVSLEASSHDQIKMTEFWLDFDYKIFSLTNLNVRTWPKDYTNKC